MSKSSEHNLQSVLPMSKKTTTKKVVLPKFASAKFLNIVPFENGFRFFTSIGNYTGVTATNLNEFATKLQFVPAESVKFHFERKDFQKWIKNTIKDEGLSEKINMIKEAQSTEDLRKEILTVLS